MSLMELLERFVTAQEKQAEAAMLMASAPSYGERHPLGCSAPAQTPDEKPAFGNSPEIIGHFTKAPPLTTWDPFTEKIQGRYGKDKIEVLDYELKARGISIKASATGAEKHQALLDCDKDLDLDPEAQAEEKTEESTPPAAQPATIDDVRTLAQEAVKGGMTPTQVQDIFEEIGGSRRLPEIEEQHMPAIHAKLTTASKAAVKKG